MVCKFCHQARWKMIAPYFTWGAVFLVGAWWSLTHKLSGSAGSDNFLTLMLPVVGAIFGMIGAVMLLMALIATLRGLSVRKVTAAPLTGSSPAWQTTASSPPAGPGAGDLNPPAINASIPDAAPPNPAVPSALDKQKSQAIHCQKCKHENAPGAEKCSQCGTNLLPGAGMRQRLGVLGTCWIAAVICFAIAFWLLKYKPEFGVSDLILSGVLIGLGVLSFGVGILLSLRKVPLHERYEIRAKRHVSLNPWQAIIDYGSAISSAPQTQAFDYLLERGKLFQMLAMRMEAMTDWGHALENVNARMAKPKASVIDLKKQRAEVYKYLGKEDEYAMEMLQYTIEKEQTFEFRRGQITEGWEDGLKKGSEDFQRQELQKLRAEIMENHKYGIVGQCKQCKSIVDLDAKLDCTNDSKHRNIASISPTLRTIDPS